jgi:hypothetical protein
VDMDSCVPLLVSDLLQSPPASGLTLCPVCGKQCSASRVYIVSDTCHKVALHLLDSGPQGMALLVKRNAIFEGKDRPGVLAILDTKRPL